MIKMAAAMIAIVLLSGNADARARFEAGGIISRDDRYPHTMDTRGWKEVAPFRVSPRQVHRRAGHVRAPRHATARPVERTARAGLVTIQTAAGIPITVATSAAGKFTGFIADLVARGIKPSTIHCYARGGHVHGSFHYSGRACDFNGSANRWAAMSRGRVADLAAKWGLRDGCSFTIRGGRPDCGHIDTGSGVRVAWHRHHIRLARR